MFLQLILDSGKLNQAYFSNKHSHKHLLIFIFYVRWIKKCPSEGRKEELHSGTFMVTHYFRNVNKVMGKK
jgi:hypothetical protein